MCRPDDYVELRGSPTTTLTLARNSLLHHELNLLQDCNDVMARDNSTARKNGHAAGGEGDAEEAAGLLQESRDRDASPDADPINGQNATPRKQPPLRRQSSFARPRADGTPRTSNRVRFDMAEPRAAPEPNGSVNGREWIEEEDYLSDDHAGGRRSDTAHRVPLLTDIEAPSVTLATEEFNPDDLLESARPKSGMKSAFMNMANSIIGAGIIGQPYAFKQAGLLTGVFLLVALTVTVDWTIRLIVTNSKLSGTNSFQETMQHCFGKSGLVAISVAQWAFAFGGMVAFCIIIGDTIPHVLAAVFPSLPQTSVLWLLTDRRAIIVLFVLGMSYPLSLYRDIAMVRMPISVSIVPN
jgi:sodium-coupled neutral amino acid transporter 11